MKAGIAEVLFRPFHYRWRIDGQIAACLAHVAWLIRGHLLEAPTVWGVKHTKEDGNHASKIKSIAEGGDIGAFCQVEGQART